MQFSKRIFHHGRQHQQLLWLTLLIASFAALLSYSSVTKNVDWFFYDGLQQFSQLPPADDIVIINIDEKSLAAIGRWPWSRDIHAKLLDQLNKAKTGTVVFDVIFSEVDQRNPEADKQFAQALALHGRVLLPIYIEQLGLQGQFLEVPPAPLFYQSALAVGHVHVAHSNDGVVRGVFLKEGVGSAYWPHISVALWQSLMVDTVVLPGLRNTVNNGIKNNKKFNQQIIVRDYLNYLPMPGPQQGLRHYSYIDVLNGEVAPERLANKIIFIGANAAGLGDTLTTSVGTIFGVELNAWIFQALRSQQLIQEASIEALSIINGLVAAVLLLIFGRLSPRAFLTATFFSLFALATVTAISQLIFHYWFPVTPTIFAVIIFYPLWSWRRLEVALNFLRNEMAELILSEKQSSQLLSTGITEHVLKPEGTELIAQTIEQLKGLRHRADAHKRLIQQSLQQLHDAVLISDLKGRIIFRNKACENLLSSEEVNTGGDLLSLLEQVNLHDNQQWADLLLWLRENDKEFSVQGFHNGIQKDLLCQGRLANIYGQENDTVIITLTDVSQLKAVEKSRVEALNFLSHDLRSPMVSVLAIIERHNTAETIDRSVLNPIEVLVRKNLEYANSFLQLNRAEVLLESQLHLCDLHSVLDFSQAHAMALVETKQISLVTQRIDDDAWVMGDDSLLERAVINLVSNAVKYSPAGSEITLSLSRRADQFQISVSDQGCGIALQDRSTIFKRYNRLDQHRNIMGAGLGLSFVATVAKRHLGTIAVESVVGQGSCFILSLNAVEVDSNGCKKILD